MIHEVGGFWSVEDDVARIDTILRAEMDQWKELHDENGDKFYFNTDTQQTMLEDPREALYYFYWQRLKLVAKMRGLLPKFARALRPHVPSGQELEAIKLEKEKEMNYMRAVIKVQTMYRIMKAKMTVKTLQQKKMVGRVPGAFQGRIRLRVDPPGP